MSIRAPLYVLAGLVLSFIVFTAPPVAAESANITLDITGIECDLEAIYGDADPATVTVPPYCSNAPDPDNPADPSQPSEPKPIEKPGDESPFTANLPDAIFQVGGIELPFPQIKPGVDSSDKSPSPESPAAFLLLLSIIILFEVLGLWLIRRR